MSPLESRPRDPSEGDLAEPPPSDLSEYTWDDSETERLEPGAGESARATAPVRPPRSVGDDIGRFVGNLDPDAPGAKA